MFRSIVFTFLSFTLAASAETFTLESAVSYALSHNPELAAARFGIAEAEGRLRQSGRLANPELESELRPNVRGREFSFGVGFTQKFPLTDRLRIEKAVSRAEVAAAMAEVKAAERRLALAVKTSGVKLLSLEGTQALMEKQIANSRELAESATRLAALAEGSPVEAAQFDLEAQQLALDLLQLDSERAVLTGELRPLLGLPAGDSLALTGSLPAVSAGTRSAGNPDALAEYQAALARAEAARVGVSLAKANRWEDAGVGLSAEVERAEDAPGGLGTDGIIGIKFTLPLPLWNKNEGKIEEARAAADRADQEAVAISQNIRAEAAAALGEMTAARRIFDQVSDTLLPKAREIEERIAAFRKQAQPGTELADLLRAREKRLTLEQARLDALRTWHLARVRFEAASGF